MGMVIVKTVNDRLLNLDYSDPEVVKQILSNYNMMKRLAEKGDTVATAIILDMQAVLGGSIEDMIEDKKRALKNRDKSVLTDVQFIVIVFVLIFGYEQSEVAYILGCTKQAVNAHLYRGIKRICRKLEGRCKEDEKNKKKRRRSGRQVVKRT